MILSLWHKSITFVTVYYTCQYSSFEFVLQDDLFPVNCWWEKHTEEVGGFNCSDRESVAVISPRGRMKRTCLLLCKSLSCLNKCIVTRQSSIQRVSFFSSVDFTALLQNLSRLVKLFYKSLQLWRSGIQHFIHEDKILDHWLVKQQPETRPTLNNNPH